MTEYVQRHRIRRKTITRRPRHYGWVVQRVQRFRRQHCGNLGQGIGGGLAQYLITSLIDITQAQHDGFGFIGIEHQRRQKQTAA
ncbi:hypothetical protein D3C85_1611420 [compost metagenome]